MRTTTLVLALMLVCVLAVSERGEAQQPLVIGASISLSGKYAASAEYQQQAYLLWAEQLNARGGLLGRPVEIRIYDDRSDPATGVRLYEKLIGEDKVDLVVGPYSSAVTAAVSTVAEKRRMPLVAPMAAAEDIFSRGYKYVFQVITPAHLYFPGAVELAAQNGVKSVALTGEDSEYPRAAVPAGQVAAEKKGMKIINLGFYPKGIKDFSAIITRAKSQGAEMFICGCYEPDSIQLVRQAKELDYNPKLFVAGVGPAVPEFAKALGKDADYVIGTDHWDPRVQTPGNPEFVAAFTKKFARVPGYHAAGSYGGMQVLEAAVKKAGSVEPEKLRSALLQLDIVTIFGRYKVTETGAQVGKSAFLLQWQNGKKEIIWPSEVATAKPVIPVPAWADRR